jgi:hypothetical protein
VKRIPTGARKVRPYCQQPANCVAPSRGACRLCQAVSFERYGAGGRKARGTDGTPDAPPPVDPAVSPPQAPPVSGPATETDASELPTTGPELADALDAIIEKHDLSRTRVSMHLCAGATGGISQLRQGKQPRRKRLARIHDFLRDPPVEQFRRKREFEQPQPGSVRQLKLSRREAGEKPDTPLMDEGERQATKAARRGAGIRRDQERAATAKLDAGVDPSKAKSTFQGQLMREIARRREDEVRQTDPIEQAKLALQRKGRVVYSASVSGGRKDRFIVSGQPKELTPAELVALAEKVTGQTFRRSA